MGQDKSRAIVADIDKVSRDLRQLGDDVREEADFIAEEVGAAEFVAASSLTESLGIMLQAGGRFAEIWQEQVSLGVEDVTQLFTRAAEGAPGDALAEFAARRTEHTWQGLLKTQAAVLDEQARILSSQQAIWHAFFEGMTDAGKRVK